MKGGKSAGTVARWPRTWRNGRTPSHVRHASAASTKAANTKEKSAALKVFGKYRGAVTQSARLEIPGNDGSSGARQDPAGVDRHGDVGPRSRPRPHSRGRLGRDRRRPEHHPGGRGVCAAPARRGSRGDGLVEQVDARQVGPRRQG